MAHKTTFKALRDHWFTAGTTMSPVVRLAR